MIPAFHLRGRSANLRVQSSKAFENYTTLVTNGTGVYCTTAQEDNATLEALLRAAIYKLVDFTRIIVMRTASDFDRPYDGEPDTVNLFYADQGSFEPAIQNIYLAGREVIAGITGNWAKTFKKGITAPNYGQYPPLASSSGAGVSAGKTPTTCKCGDANALV